ncbi:MAG: cyclic nucleotide-binding domain-containing protein [Legionellaceae bacterium]|nr:cyclic nucleotide-binding domain-containing protein [Legionellaceae bacterium]
MRKLYEKIIPNIIAGNSDLEKNYIVCLTICIVSSIVSTAITVYSYSKFLSLYPTTWIAYWLMAESLMMIVFGNLFGSSNSNNMIGYVKTTSVLSIVIVGIAMLLSADTWYWTTVIELLVMKLFLTNIRVILWPFISSLFYRHHYKHLQQNFSICISLSCIIAPVLCAQMTSNLPVESLLAFIVISLIVLFFVVNSSKQVLIPDNKNSIKEKAKQVESPINHPLLLLLLLLGFIFASIEFFSNLFFMQEMGIKFNEQEIGTYTSYFLIISNIVILAVQYKVPIIFKKFRFSIILIITFVVMSLVSIFHGFLAALWASAFLYLITLSARIGFFDYLQNFISNLYPPTLMMKYGLYQKNIVRSSSSVICGLFATSVLYKEHSSLCIILIFSILGILGIIVSIKIFANYLKVLKKYISITSFSFHALGDKERKTIQNLIITDLETKHFGVMHLGLITPKFFPYIPLSLYKVLEGDASDEIKSTVIKILNKYNTNLLDNRRLISIYEKAHCLSQNCRDLLYKLLVSSHSTILLNEIRSDLQKHQSASKNELIFLLKNGNTEDYIMALQKTTDLSNSKDPKDRLISAKVLGFISEGAFYDMKIKLLEDPEQHVRSTAMRNLQAEDVLYLLPNLAGMLNSNNINLLIKRLDISNLLDIADKLMSLYREKTLEYSQTAINFITVIPDFSVEAYIKELLNQQDNYSRTLLATKLAIRKNIIPISSELIDYLNESLLFEEKLIASYQLILLSLENKDIKVLIKNRIYYARQRLVYWYACTQNNHTEITKVISKINPYHDSHESRIDKDNAIEYLISKEKNYPIKNLLESSLYDNLSIPKSKKVQSWDSIDVTDPWLKYVTNKYLTTGKDDMNLLQRTIAMQQTEFFEGLPDEVLFELSKSCSVMDFAVNETILTENEPGTDLYILVDGEVDIYKNENHIGTFKPYKCFGEMSLFADIPRTSTIISKERSIFLVIEKQDFLSITDEFPQILRTIIKIVIDRFSDQIDTLKNKE